MEKWRSLTETPTWAVATVVAIMIGTVLIFTRLIESLSKWLVQSNRKRKPLLAALNKIKEELMVFGVMSLLLGHWSIYVAKICIKSSIFDSQFYPCIPETYSTKPLAVIQHINISISSKDVIPTRHDPDTPAMHTYCDKGYESLASYESLEQLHRLLLVLGITHITYSSLAIVLAVFKIYSWRAWENEAKFMATNTISANPTNPKLARLSTFILHHASHPWSQHKILVWLLCFSRQFWSSINKFDYTALRLAFLTTHQLPLSYDFLNYMVRSMHDEFRDIVGISVPMWIYAIFCIFLDFHGSYAYFWLSFLPAILMMLIGMKLHHIVVKLALEAVDASPYMKNHVFQLRDELFWLRKPNLLLKLMQLISFQNAFEMAMFLWSLWEINGTSCFMDNSAFMIIRLAFGLISQVWCSFITFPLYVIVTQMGSRVKRTLISEGVRTSLHGWRKRVKAKQVIRNSNARLSSSSSMPLIHNSSNNDIKFSERDKCSLRSGWSRRYSIVDGDVGVLFSAQQQPDYTDEDESDESCNSSYSSKEEYDEEDHSDDGSDDIRYFHIL